MAQKFASATAIEPLSKRMVTTAVSNPSTIAANLKPLVRQNWVFVLADADDRRATRLFLTAAGSERLKMALHHLQEFDEALAVQIGGKRNARTVCHALSGLTAACL
jgi:DNA-binding MarR family transcriptional regulator